MTSVKIVKLQYGVLALLGLSFGFVLGFPFANHNESYKWVALLSNLDFAGAFMQPLETVATYRPLGQGVAWLLYMTFGGSIWPVEVFNYLTTAAGWLLVFLAVKEKRVFSLVSLATGAMFFSGYIYLFHLHGVFYGLLFVLLGVAFREHHRQISLRGMFLVILSTAVAYLFHPFALLIGLSFWTGTLVERRMELRAEHRALLLGSAAAAIAVALEVEHRRSIVDIGECVQGLVVSYRSLEATPAVSLGIVGLILVTVICIKPSRRWAAVSSVAMILLSGLLLAAHVPVTLLWICVCLAKATVRHKWVYALMLGVSLAFPLFTGTGSPTYAIFVLMVCTVVAVDGSVAVDRMLHRGDGPALWSVPTLALALAIILRLGFTVPVLSAVANPVLMEREKTFQMEEIVSWMMDSGYRNRTLVLGQLADSPSKSDNAVNRVHRPPTSQRYLDAYVDWRRGASSSDPTVLIAYFGGETITGAVAVYQTNSAHAGTATVYALSR